MIVAVGGDTPVKDFTTVMIYGAARCGIGISIDDVSMPMLTDIIEYETMLMSKNKEVQPTKAKSLSEIAKGGKI